MKPMKIFAACLMAAAAAFVTSCNDWLDLAPIDYYGSEGYWKNEAHATGYIDGLHNHLRAHQFTHVTTFGDLRGGLYKTAVAVDGSALSYGDIITQSFDADHPGVSNFANIYGRITNCNLFIARVEDNPDYPIDAARKNFYLGIVHGLRAFYYFDLYRIYGWAPIRTGVEVIDGELDPNKLYVERSAPSVVAKQIEDDIEASLSFFGNVNDFDPYGFGYKHYWSKAATECLAADFYLWQAKVTTGDHTATGPGGSDLAKAKQHLQSLERNYGLALEPSFADVFSTDNKANDEVIFALFYDENEAVNNNGIWLCQNNAEVCGAGYDEDGERITTEYFTEKFTSFNRQDIEYKVDMILQYDMEDSRRLATFFPVYKLGVAGDGEDPDRLYLRGSLVQKNIGHVSSTSGQRVFDGDIILYRLAWVYLSLAEVANMEGDNASVQHYVNLVRERAYGADWNEQKYGYSPSDFKTNELAILMERTKEFVQEGFRWYDLRRMKTSPTGGPETALVFSKEAAIEAGLIEKADGTAADGTPTLLGYKLTPESSWRAALSSSEDYKVLWPLDKSLLNNEPVLTQTPGY